MREDGIGRVLVASLHQSIAETLPTRLPFYESWLSEGGLRDGTIGLAPTYAVLSFLRQEGAYYDVITSRAGVYAAEWTVQAMPPFRRSLIESMPPWLRARMLMRLMDGLVRRSYAGSHAAGRLRQGVSRIDIHASVFCTVREPVAGHLCGFYAAAYTHLLELFQLGGPAAVVACRAAGQQVCVLSAPLALSAPSHAESHA